MTWARNKPNFCFWNWWVSSPTNSQALQEKEEGRKGRKKRERGEIWHLLWFASNQIQRREFLDKLVGFPKIMSNLAGNNFCSLVTLSVQLWVRTIRYSFICNNSQFAYLVSKKSQFQCDIHALIVTCVISPAVQWVVWTIESIKLKKLGTHHWDAGFARLRCRQYVIGKECSIITVRLDDRQIFVRRCG